MEVSHKASNRRAKQQDPIQIPVISRRLTRFSSRQRHVRHTHTEGDRGKVAASHHRRIIIVPDGRYVHLPCLHAHRRKLPPDKPVYSAVVR